jgi:hypothetical protein
MSPSAAAAAATVMARSRLETGCDLALESAMRASRPRLAVRRTPPARARPRSPGPATTIVLFAISTDPTVEEREGVREIETVYETEKY